ncbi:hypothetical protein L6251_01875, partial [Candidatus Parcubacteria bacterium]|nr:hypothetical protein [Patescibacteria group bacterium]MBU4476875.1 hypothetical protein [Patescibacteria group bacterium]MCG2699148.1 hypothetical protein [Candidatus Parcubacteria bacterium]
MASQIFKFPSKIKLPKDKSESRHEEYGEAQKGLVICKRCHNVLFKKEWHHPESKPTEKFKFAGKKTYFVLCPACDMITKKLYEGDIIIENMPVKYESELAHLIAAYGARAQKRDPQDRVIAIEKRNSGFRVTTTENQLAVRLAKKIKEVFKKADIEIAHSEEPFEVGRIRIKFF